MKSVTERVNSGVSLLDERRPGWHREINVATLDIASGRCCVVGQLYGQYGTGINELRISGEAGLYGFCGGVSSSIEDLNAGWRDAIAHKRLAEVQRAAPEEVVRTLVA